MKLKGGERDQLSFPCTGFCLIFIAAEQTKHKPSADIGTIYKPPGNTNPSIWMPGCRGQTQDTFETSHPLVVGPHSSTEATFFSQNSLLTSISKQAIDSFQMPIQSPCYHGANCRLGRILKRPILFFF